MLKNLSANRKRRLSLAIPSVQLLESRRLLSGSATPLIGAYTPQQLENAYGVSALGAANQGQGITIGIVDELNDTSITTDANGYSSEYNLPKLDGVGSDPKLTVVLDTALGSVGSASGSGVGEETSLDVEMAHAMAPLANILLVQVPASGSYANEFAQLLHGVQLAASDGADAISLSYGIGESSIGTASVVTAQNTTYLSTGAASSVSVSVSTGDGGSPSYPATSPNVTAVGGTSLFLSALKGSYSFETGWGGLTGDGAGGGGLSTDFASPTFQSTNGVSFAKRAIPDVSLVADPVTGVSVYDSYDEGTGTAWTSVGGTSVASPVFGGIMGLVQQNRVGSGLAPLSSAQTDAALYSAYNSALYSSYFHDVTLGNNKDGSVTGFSAVSGYDEATGIGSPIANTLVPYLSTYIATPSNQIIHKVGMAGVLNGQMPTLADPTADGSDSSTDSGDVLFDAIDARSWTATVNSNSGSAVVGGVATSLQSTSIGESLPISSSVQITQIKKDASLVDSAYLYYVAV